MGAEINWFSDNNWKRSFGFAFQEDRVFPFPKCKCSIPIMSILKIVLSLTKPKSYTYRHTQQLSFYDLMTMPSNTFPNINHKWQAPLSKPLHSIRQIRQFEPKWGKFTARNHCFPKSEFLSNDQTSIHCNQPCSRQNESKRLTARWKWQKGIPNTFQCIRNNNRNRIYYFDLGV